MLRLAFAGPACLRAGRPVPGRRLAVLPALFHLMWRRVLAADLSSGPLSSFTPVWLAAGA